MDDPSVQEHEQGSSKHPSIPGMISFTAGSSSIALTSPTQRSLEPGHKSRRVYNKKQPLSCAECRRLKLKCDRSFPCTSCAKRGCAEICPAGVLKGGKGSRFILANTERLHEKIRVMSNRIRALEFAVAQSHTSETSEPHPLLHEELLHIASTADMQTVDEGVDPSFPSFNDDIAGNRTAQARKQVVHEFVVRGVEGLPMLAPMNIPIAHIRSTLPVRSSAVAICEITRKHLLWAYNLDESESYLTSIIRHCYESDDADLNPRRLACLHMLLALGLRLDVSEPIDPPRADQYLYYARAALSAIPAAEMPDIDHLHAMFYLIWYQLGFSGEYNVAVVSYSALGLTVKMCQSLGIHRDEIKCKGKVIPEDLQRRRVLLWELIMLDTRTALSIGRPPSFSLKHVDSKRPTYNPDSEYHEYKHAFLLDCMLPVLDATGVTPSPPYFEILHLDQKIRDYRIPPILDSALHAPSAETQPILLTQQVAVSQSRDILILQLHRSYFIRALSSSNTFTLQHEFAPSVIAVFNSAVRTLNGLKVMMQYRPSSSKRVYVFWFNVFSSLIALSFIVSRCPLVPFAETAMQEMASAIPPFRQLASDNARGTEALDMLEKLVAKSQRLLRQAQSKQRQRLLEASSKTDEPPLQNSYVLWDHCHSTLTNIKNHYSSLAASIRVVSPTSMEEDTIMDKELTLTQAVTPSRLRSQARNFDYGVLAVDLDDHNWMTWF